jgi:hypothetical protein
VVDKRHVKDADHDGRPPPTEWCHAFHRPTLLCAAPRSEQWLHEVKFDGWRIQLPKHESSAAVFTKNGHDQTCRSRITENIDFGLVEEFKTISALTSRPVKITMTRPLILAKISYDEYYNASRR